VEAQTSGKSFVDRQKILDYCKGWDLPVSAMDYGYEILLAGLLGALVGVFAWFANPTMLLALLLAGHRKRRTSLVLSAVSVALGLQSYMLEAVPFNESSMDPANLNLVDHLSYGFYLWMTSLLLFCAYCFLKAEADHVRR
jgi:hypothetical protein